MDEDFYYGGVEPIVDATEDDPLYFLFYDPRMEDEPHVYMPDLEAQEPFAHWPEEKQPGYNPF